MLSVKLFFWLTLHRCLWTVEPRKRYGLQDDDTCVLCGQEWEANDHLILGCVLTIQLWLALLFPIGLESTPRAMMLD
jgi:hypothetical protein